MPQDRVCECGQVMTVSDPDFQGRLRCPKCGGEVVFVGTAPALEPSLPGGTGAETLEVPDEVALPRGDVMPPDAEAVDTDSRDAFALEEPEAEPQPAETPTPSPQIPASIAREERPSSFGSMILGLPVRPVVWAPGLADWLDSPTRLMKAVLFAASSVPVTVVVYALALGRSRTSVAAVAGAIVAGGGYRFAALVAAAVCGHIVAWRTTGRGDFSRGLGAIALVTGVFGWLCVGLVPLAGLSGAAALWARRVFLVGLYAVFIRAGEPLLAAVYEAGDQRFLWAPAVCAVIDGLIGFVLVPAVFGMRL